MRKAFHVSLLASLLQWGGLAAAQHLQSPPQKCDVDVPASSVFIHSDRLIRSGAPAAVFGFNVPWRDFQIGYFRNGAVRPEVLKWLAPFKGALYRYPGGSLSNTFDWRRAVGPVAGRQPQRADFGRMARVELGFPEFGLFLQQVHGKAMLTVNMSGPPEAQMSPADATNSALRAVKAMRADPSFRCEHASTCLLQAVELGNELDWNPYNWDAEKYVDRAKRLISALDAEVPGLELIANGRTAPWDSRSRDFRVFNTALSDGLATRVQGIAVHPYYEGIPVQQALRFIEAYGSTWTLGRKDARVYVTEHGRWPSLPAAGRWEKNWYQTTSLGGAIATAEFMLGLLPNAHVAGANWHALAADGPWQLFQWDRQSDRLTPTPLYWALRALREAFLEDVVEVSVLPIPGRVDRSKSIRLIAMTRSEDRSKSLLGVNRSDRPIELSLKGEPGGQATLRLTGGSELSAVNTPDRPTSVAMEVIKSASPTGDFVLCIPRSTVFSVMLQPS